MYKVDLYYHDKQVRSLWSDVEIQRGQIRQFLLNFKNSIDTFNKEFITLRFYKSNEHIKTVTNVKEYL